MSKPFNEKFREQRRLFLLKLLSEQGGYRANSAVLYMSLYHLGIQASQDDVRTDLHWLRDQSLITLDEVGESVEIATLTKRGIDVVHGLAEVPGVSRGVW